MRYSTPTLNGLLLAILILTCSTTLKSQYYWDLGINAGASNYLGDIGGKQLTRRDFVSDMRMRETKMTIGGFARYKISHLFSVQGNISWVRIAGDDKLSSNPARNARNLNFRNDMLEATAQMQLFFYEVTDLGNSHRYENNFRAFVGLGAGALYHNPKTSFNGEMVALRPLTTEGRKYSKVTAVVPASAGFYFTFNKNYRIGWNLTWRTTFSDYLDDVSTTYAAPSQLPSELAIQLANRTDELSGLSTGFADNFTPGNKRGDARHNDSYLTSSVDLSYALQGRSIWERKHYHWIGDRIKHPDKYNGSPSHRTHLGLVRKIRLHW